MTELATSNTDQSAAPSKMKRISTKVRAAIDLMVSGKWKKIVDAAREVGRARESLSRALSKPHIAEHMRQPVMESLAWAAARAGAIKIELLDSPSEHVRDNASSFLLGLVNQPDHLGKRQHLRRQGDRFERGRRAQVAAKVDDRRHTRRDRSIGGDFFALPHLIGIRAAQLAKRRHC
jgi:hypothetical protein